jgi:hypothetical protein
MSASNAIITPPDIVLTPMRVTFFNPAAPSVPIDLGGTVEGVTFSVKTKFADIKVDQFGDTALNSIVSGHSFMVKTTFAETANKQRWSQAFPNFNLVTDNDGNQLFVMNMAVGDDLLSHAGKLILHPLSKADADTSEDVTINLAACKGASDLKYGPDKQVGLAIEFEVYPDTTVSPARFCTYGDPTIGVVQATHGSVTPGGGNVGNGTVTAVAVTSGKTITETMTIACTMTDASLGNNFTVVGSVSGELGSFTLAPTSTTAHNFVNPKFSFTITQGTIEFAHGDSFTCTTTAANYV